MLPKNRVLIISNPEDEHTRRIYARLSELEVEPLLFFPEELGQRLDFSWGLSRATPLPLQTLWFDRNMVDVNTVFSIWYRRPRLVALNDYALSPEGREFARDEWRAVLEGLYALLPQALWVSHPDKLREAARKPFQLVLARQLGFYVPRTLITNNPLSIDLFHSVYVVLIMLLIY